MQMDPAALQQRLAETEDQIANGERQIAEQRKLVVELDGKGQRAAHAKYLLAGLELLQTARRDSREWLLKQLNLS
jgi:uncharacterized coiled-coil protein SlyX